MTDTHNMLMAGDVNNFIVRALIEHHFCWELSNGLDTGSAGVSAVSKI